MTRGATMSDTSMSQPTFSKLNILSALNESTKQASKAEAEKKRLAEEAQKAKELKREQGAATRGQDQEERGETTTQTN